MSSAALLAVAIGYMGVLFTLASLVDRSKGLARNLSRRPFVQALALGTYATTWSMFGSVGFALTEGYRFLAIQVGDHFLRADTLHVGAARAALSGTTASQRR